MKVFAIAMFIGLAFLLALLPFTQGVPDRYEVEEIDVDEKKDEPVFRVPSHNNVDDANLYHDFNMRVTVTRMPSRKVCYISEMDSSLSSPRKLKEDLERAASQTGQLPVTTKSNLMMVTGPANRHFLPQKILDFCGMLPIYNVETLINETSGSGIRHRIARQTSLTVTTFELCDRNAMAYITGCMRKRWDLSCKIHAQVRCTNQQPVWARWKCLNVHFTYNYPVCCDLICPP